MDWIPLRTNIFRKRKIGDLPAPDFKAWMLLLCEAGDREQGGMVGDIDDIAYAMRSIPDLGGATGGASDDVAVAQAIVDRLVERGLVERVAGGKRGVRFSVHDWSDWQLKSMASEDKRKPNRAAQTILDYSETKKKTTLDARAREGGESDQNREEQKSQRSIAEQIEPSVRPISNGHDEEHQAEESSAPADPKAVREAFEEMWLAYWGIPGNPNSSKMRAWETFQQLTERDQIDATIGVINWRLSLNGKDAGFATPDPTRKTKIKFLENWLGDEQWKQFIS